MDEKFVMNALVARDNEFEKIAVEYVVNASMQFATLSATEAVEFDFEAEVLSMTVPLASVTDVKDHCDEQA